MDCLNYNDTSCLKTLQRPNFSSCLPIIHHALFPPRAYVDPKYQDNGHVNTDRGRIEYSAASSTSHTAEAGPSTTMPPKRTSSGSPTSTPQKVPKTEQKPEDFSNSVKKRLAGSSRTGQACDRCKIRKIRCDGLPGGCSPCLQNQTECRTTDRITGRAAPRGYVEGLENQNVQLHSRIAELERMLMNTGIDVKPSTGYHEPPSAPASVQPYQFNAASGSGPQWSGTVTTSSSYATAAHGGQPILKTGFSGDHYLGISSGNSHLSSIKGTALSILGMEIDIADFTSQDMDEPDNSTFHPALYNKSYQAFLQSSLNINPRIEKVDLPPREEGLTYAEWYFRVLNPYLPILHKPTFMKIITQMYDEPTFKPTTAETVMVHMVFAIMFFQYASRNWENASQQATLNQQSNLHYHYCIGMFYELTCSHSVADAQALALLCAHLRNFPKPGASWVMTSTTLGLAVELGMHRSIKSRPPSERAPNALDIEIRKRTFWCILAIHVTLSGKLGRPIHIRMDDIDVEFPEPLDDDLLSEAGIDTSRPGKCTFKIGIAGLSIVPVFMELYSTIYAVRRNPDNYIETVKAIEARLVNWIDNLPDEITKGESGADQQEGRVFALYSQNWIHEVRMLLYHPSTSLTIDPAFNAESMRICVDSARKMLVVVSELQKLKSLDTTWYQSAVYVMAITTTLFYQWEKRNEMTAKDLADLQKEMDVWLEVMGDVGLLLGSGTKLREAVRNVTDGTLGLLSHSLKEPSYPAQVTGGTEVATKSPTRRVGAATNSSHPNQGYQNTSNYANSSPPINNNTNAYIPPDNTITHQQTPYPTATQYSNYPDPASSSSNSIAYTPSTHHSSFSYPSGTSDVEAPLLAAFANQASQVAPQNWQRSHSHHAGTNVGHMNTSQSWQQWTSTVAGSIEPQDCFPASALMQLGGRDLDGGMNAPQVRVNSTAPIADMNGAHAAVMAVAHMQDANGMGGPGMTWPLNIFDMQPGPQGQ